MNWEEIMKEKSKASSSGLHLLFYYKGSKISRLFNFKKSFILRRKEWSQINVLTRIHMNKLEKGNINPKQTEGHNNMSWNPWNKKEKNKIKTKAVSFFKKKTIDEPLLSLSRKWRYKLPRPRMKGDIIMSTNIIRIILWNMPISSPTWMKRINSLDKNTALTYYSRLWEL